jgi:hypothetical protein
VYVVGEREGNVLPPLTGAVTVESEGLPMLMMGLGGVVVVVAGGVMVWDAGGTLVVGFCCFTGSAGIGTAS